MKYIDRKLFSTKIHLSAANIMFIEEPTMLSEIDAKFHLRK